MQDEKTTAAEPSEFPAWFEALLSEPPWRTRMAALLDRVPGVHELRAELGLTPIMMRALVSVPGPARDEEIEFDAAHAEVCEGCRLRARNELRVEPEPAGVLFDAGGCPIGMPRLVRGLVVPGEPDPPPWVTLVFSSGRSHVVDLPDTNHWSSWTFTPVPEMPFDDFEGLIVDDPAPRVLDPGTRGRWQERARAFYTEEFRVGVRRSLVNGPDDA